jgi:hypothetical protein
MLMVVEDGLTVTARTSGRSPAEFLAWRDSCWHGSMGFPVSLKAMPVFLENPSLVPPEVAESCVRASLV